jgi:putative ABC transport system substrate-binding protein
LEETEEAARRLGRRLRPYEIRDISGIDRAFRAAKDARASALLVIPGSVIDSHSRQIVEAAARTRLPAIYGFKAFVEAGGLLSYGIDTVDTWRRAAFYVDKIMKGANAADLPVEQPSKFEMVVSVRAAKALRLTIPPSLLLRADQVLE